MVDPERGGRLASLEVRGLELVLPRADEGLRWGCYPMAPWAGRTRRGRFTFDAVEYTLPLSMPPHAIHGTTHDRSWRSLGGGRSRIDLGPDWPFPGHAFQELLLDPGSLVLRLEVHALGAPFPASLGWHPWFPRRLARGGPAVLSFGARRMYRRDAEGIPDGVLVEPGPAPWDDCFTGLEGPPVITWPGAARLVLESDADHWVVYDEPEHALCVEPQTGPPDALNLAPRVVRPGEPLALTLTLRWELLS